MISAPTRTRIWGALIYLCVALVLIVMQILPLHSKLSSLPGPDLLIALSLAWVLRRPEQLPVLLIAAMILIEDLLILRPIGLKAMLVVLATEFLRRRQATWHDLSFVTEWLVVSLILGLILLAQRVILLLSFTPQPALGQEMLQLLATVACYPLVVASARLILGLRRPAPGEVDELGHTR